MTKRTFKTSGVLDRKRVTSHPGEILREDVLTPLGMSARTLADKIDVPLSRLTGILAGRRRVTADTAIRLSRYLGTTPEFWMNLQAMHDLTSAIVENRKHYQKIEQRETEADDKMPVMLPF